MGRLGGCSNVHGMLKSCAWVTSNEDNKQSLLYKPCGSLKKKINLPHEKSKKAKFLKCLYTPRTLKGCTQVTSRIKHTLFVSGTIQYLVRL